jgi:hypothetical protein
LAEKLVFSTFIENFIFAKNIRPFQWQKTLNRLHHSSEFVQIRREGWFDNFCDQFTSFFICQKLVKIRPVVSSTVRSFPDDDRD